MTSTMRTQGGPVDDWLRRAHAEWTDRPDHLDANKESTITEENHDA
jgi:hypothetical protein